MHPLKLYNLLGSYLGILYVPAKVITHLTMHVEPFYVAYAETPSAVISYHSGNIPISAGSFTMFSIQKHKYDGVTLAGIDPEKIHNITEYAFAPSLDYMKALLNRE
jgi:hypothetical protein